VLADDIIEASDTLSSIMSSSSEVPINELDVVTSVRDCGHVIQLILIWYTHDAYHRAETLKSSRSITSGTVSSEPRDPEIQSSITTILAIRDKHLDMLSTWMSHGSAADEDMMESGDAMIEVSEAHRYLQREAFQLIGDLRLLYPLALADFHDVDDLAFTVPQDLLSKMRFVFDYEGKMILNEIANAKSTTELDELSMKLITAALRPLGTAMYYDPEHLNRRQASAVMMYYLMDPPSEKIMEFIKLFSKRFKDKDVIRYMEIQLVTLKSYYQDNIADVLKRRIDRYNGKTNERCVSLAEENEALQASLAKFQLLSKKLSSGLGVGKVKDEQSITALTNFIRACVDFAFTEDHHLVFLAGISNYIKFLPPTYMRELNNHLQTQLRYRDMEEIESWPQELSIVHQSVVAFRSQLTGSSSAAKVVRVTGEATSSSQPSRRRVKTARTSKRPIGQLETVEEEGEGMDEEEEGGSDDELALPVPKRKPAPAAKPKAPIASKNVSTAKPKKAAAPPQPSTAASARPSRKASEKSKSYYEGYDDELGYNDIRSDSAEDKSSTAKPVTKASSSKTSEDNIALGLALEDDDFEQRELSPIKRRGSSTGTIQSLPISRPQATTKAGSSRTQKHSMISDDEEEQEQEQEDQEEEEESEGIEVDDDLDMILSVPIRQQLR
jgi:hypothetical protein